MKSLLLLLIISTAAFAGHLENHKCIHDTISERFPGREITEINLSEEDERHLQTVSPRNMKITYDISYFNKLSTSTQDQLFKQNVEKTINIITKYFSELITIIPKPAGQMKWTSAETICGLVPIPQSDITTDKDSDLHLYISFTDEPAPYYLAYASWCRFLAGLGATHAQVNINRMLLLKENLNDPIVFQKFVQIIIHEMIHVLGFSKDLAQYAWVDATKKRYAKPILQQVVNGKILTFIQTPNIVKVAREYFSCSTLPGLPLFNNESTHWDPVVILDELMTPDYQFSKGIMSIFTAALLRDTGFYYSVNANLEEPSFYGKYLGCGFILNKCNENMAKMREFCQVASGNCDYYHNGPSKCSTLYIKDPQCPSFYGDLNNYCFNEKHISNTPTNVQNFGTSFGTNSKCFVSSLYSGPIPIPNSPLCYQYECIGEKNYKQVIVKVGTSSAICYSNNQQVTVNGYKGVLNCPSNLNDFCAYEKMCPKHCSLNGYCANGVCLCRNGFTGNSCEIQI